MSSTNKSLGNQNTVQAVFERIRPGQGSLIKRYLKKKRKVWILEPFHAYHHRKVRFYPEPLPVFARDLIKQDRVSLIPAASINARDISLAAADRAVATTEAVYPSYQAHNKPLIDRVASVTGSEEANLIFKSSLCNRLAEFFSINMVTGRIAEYLNNEQFLFYPDFNIDDYQAGIRLLKAGGIPYDAPNGLIFSNVEEKRDVLSNYRDKLGIAAKLLAQTVVSGLLFNFRARNNRSKKYGIVISSPHRQLRNRQRGPDFLIDGKKIKQDEVVFFTENKLNESQKTRLEEIGCIAVYTGNRKLVYSRFSAWAGVLWRVLLSGFKRNGEEIKSACIALLHFFRWEQIQKENPVNNLITHADFGLKAIARNALLRKKEVQTWYFTDSMNTGGCFQEGEMLGRHPFWAFLRYDHLVTWNGFLGEYFDLHPSAFSEKHIVGCLWSQYLNGDMLSKDLIPFESDIVDSGHFILGVFDSTYSINSITSYLEGIAFAEHILRLAEDHSDIIVLFKEKKSREIHAVFDVENGPRLIELYDKMNAHPRIRFVDFQAESATVMSACDMVVSFPFTSTSFEFLSAKKPAIWHDALALMQTQPYGRQNLLTTHGYMELSEMVTRIKDGVEDNSQELSDDFSMLMDPYRDGKAIDRFRDLLVAL